MDMICGGGETCSTKTDAGDENNRLVYQAAAEDPVYFWECRLAIEILDGNPKRGPDQKAAVPGEASTDPLSVSYTAILFTGKTAEAWAMQRIHPRKAFGGDTLFG